MIHIIYMKFTINSNSKIHYNALLWYITKLPNTCKHLVYNLTEIISKPGDTLIEKNHFICNDNNFEFTYKNLVFSVIIETADLLSASGPGTPCSEMVIYKEVTIEYVKNCDIEPTSISKSKTIEFIESLFIIANTEYNELKKIKYSKDNIIISTLDSFWWEEIQEVPGRDIDTIILDKELKNNIKTSINKYNDESVISMFKSLGITNKLNIILEGLPGTGKSSLCIAIATMLHQNIATIDFNQPDLSDLKFIKALRKFPDNSICLLEDFDALFINREKTNNSKVSFTCILNFLDGAYSRNNLVTILTTNHINKIDKAILRPMRTDYIFTFNYCSKYQCKIMYGNLFPDLADKDNFDNMYNLIKDKKFTTCMLQKWFINSIIHSKSLLDDIKGFDELINISSEKNSSNMFT